MPRYESFYLGFCGNSSSTTRYCFKYGMAETKCPKKRIGGHTGFNKLTERVMYYTVRDGMTEEKKFKYFITELFSQCERVHFFDKSEFFYLDKCNEDTFDEWTGLIKKISTEYLSFAQDVDDNIV